MFKGTDSNGPPWLTEERGDSFLRSADCTTQVYKIDLYFLKSNQSLVHTVFLWPEQIYNFPFLLIPLKTRHFEMQKGWKTDLDSHWRQQAVVGMLHGSEHIQISDNVFKLLI